MQKINKTLYKYMQTSLSLSSNISKSYIQDSTNRKKKKMAAKNQPEVQGYPLAPAAVMPRSDEEYGNNRRSDEQIMRKKKRMKCFAYIAVFFVLQAAVILVLGLTVMRVKTPKVRMDGVTATSSPNGDVKFGARVLVKNTNFGRYKFDSTLGTIRTANGTAVQFAIQEARAKARSTKKIAFVADLGASGGGAGTLELTVEAKLSGKVELMKIIKKKKTADMSCTLTVVLATNSVQNLRCK